MSNIRMFQTTSRIIRGNGSVKAVADEVKRLGKKQVLVVTDPGLAAAGVLGKLEDVLREAAISYSVFDQVESDPQLQTAINAKETILAEKAELVIGIGGGSPIDIAKVSSILAANPVEIGEIIGIDQVPAPGLPTIIIPTTAGTGSEVTPIAILSDHDDKLKKGVVSPFLFPTTAILDAELTVGLPPHVTAATGMDALIHAVEAFTSKNCDYITDMLAEKAMQLIYENIVKVYDDGTDLAARQNMLEASMLAGMAFANAGVTAVHAFAYPIGAEFHIPHGVANSIMLVPVMEFNLSAIEDRFARISALFGLEVSDMNDRDKAAATMKSLKELSRRLSIPEHLGDFGVKDEHIEGLAEGVLKVTRLLANNRKELTAADCAAIYRQVL